MSWLTDLAGKAEELLNKVDQSAAIALKKEEGLSRSSTPIRNVVDPLAYDPPQQHRVDKPAAIAPLPSSAFLMPARRPVQAQSRAPPEVTSPRAKSRKQDEVEEEKLFEFLNCAEKPATSKKEVAAAAAAAAPIMPQSAGRNRVAPPTGSGGAPQQVLENSAVETPVVESDSAEAQQSIKETAASSQDQSLLVVSEPTTQSRLSSLELENRLLRSEVSSLNQELQQSLQRTLHVEKELRHVQKQLQQSALQLSNGEKATREMLARQLDLAQALEAKDSQLAVLRVRLQEADDELAAKRDTVARLQAENSRILDDQSSSSGLQSQAIQTVQDRLQQAEERLEQEQTQFRSVQAESLQRLARLEEELRSVAASYADAKSKLHEEKSRSADLAGHLRTARNGLESTQQELGDYKAKAQRILQSKERLIVTLKESSGNGGDASAEIIAASAVELEELRQEREALKDELTEASRQVALARAELQESESQMQQEVDAARDYGRNLDERLRDERARREDVEQEMRQLKEELRYLHDDSMQQKVALQSRVTDRDAEIERLRKQLMAKKVNSSSHGELEVRLNALTESLIQKQTMLEALSTEKSALVFQMERTEQRLRELSMNSGLNASMAVSLSDDNDVKLRVPAFMTETPFDGQMARKVKRVYNTIDTLSFRLGVFLRRYPMARILIIVYMAMLHLWVMVVLFTYSPEIHDKDCSVPNGKR